MRVGCFSFVVVFLLARGVHSPAVGGFAALRMRQVKPLFLLWEKWDVFNLQLFFLPARLGPKPLFLLHHKRKSGSGLRKRKGRPVEIMGRYDTTGRWICAVMVSLG